LLLTAAFSRGKGAAASGNGFYEGSDLANPELGAKQICPNCQSKFYDLARRPAVCPKCATAFDPEEALKSRRVRARTTTPDYEAEDEAPKVVPEVEADGFEEEVDDTPEVDEIPAEPIETDEDVEDPVGAAPAPADELGVDFAEDEELEEEADDVPFLEDEDEDDNFEDEIEVPNTDDD
jgi:uncharacterized protein (TIGR02300 family)